MIKILELNAYILIIIACIVVLISYIFSIISKRTNIPSVILLIGLGILIKQWIRFMGYDKLNFFPILEIFGIVGLIMIVLEAALDLELSAEKWETIWKSFLTAFILLGVNAFVISFLIKEIFTVKYIISMLYAIPLSIISSAIVLPSMNVLSGQKKEFLIYEATFSDILGIMFFYFVLDFFESESISEITMNFTGNLFITIFLSLLIGYALVYFIQQITSHTKFFILISVLVALYSLGKLFHLSSLIIILVFGLMIKNTHLFFFGRLQNFLKKDVLNEVYEDFRLVTIESSFIVRTFFFVIFGITISLSTLLNTKVLIISLVIIFIIFGLRILLLRFVKGKDISPEIFIAPRGLISILLYFSIPKELIVQKFESGILLLTILFTSVIMAFSLVRVKSKSKSKNGQKSDYKKIISDKKDFRVRPVKTESVVEKFKKQENEKNKEKKKPE